MIFDIRYFETVESTMDIARAAAEQNPVEGLVIQGGEQTGGRGRRGNQWLSPHGNLYQSIVLCPEKDKKEWGQLSFVIAVALANSLLKYGVQKDHIKLKWPNDLLIDGMKAAGILIEAADNFVIIGTGININYAPDDRSKLCDYGINDINVFRDVFLNEIDKTYLVWLSDGFEPVRDQWMDYAYRLGQEIQANLKKQSITGIFHNIDNDGTLLLTDKSGTTRKISSGEIIYVSGH